MAAAGRSYLPGPAALSLTLEKSLGGGEFWTLDLTVDRQRRQLSVVSTSRLSIAGSVRGAGSPVNSAEAVGIAFQRALELGEGLHRRVQLHEHLAQQLARRCDVPRGDRMLVAGVFRFRRGSHQLQRLLTSL